MVNNIRIECHNVIVKLVEEDIIFTLNVKTATLSPMDEEWNPSFIGNKTYGGIFGTTSAVL